MTALFAAQVRLGGDPRHLEAFKHLCTELAKLNHPACPDVHWERVEGLCLALFKENGIDLQSGVAFVLALGNQRGAEGLVQGFALLEELARQWPGIWPKADATRLEILDWLCQQVLVMLRGLSVAPTSLTRVMQLQAQVRSLQDLLRGHVSQAPAGLQSLDQYLAGFLQHLERSRLPLPMVLPGAVGSETQVVMPLFVLPPVPVPSPFVIEPRRVKPRLLLGLGTAVLLAAMAGWAGWAHWQSDLRETARLSEVVSLGALTLFEAGSAELKADSTMALMAALLGITAHPGRLIVITGHADSSGDSARNRELSRDRALAVRAWIQRMSDLPDDCFAIRHAADSQPVASNDHAPGRAANRRVDIHLLPQAQGCGA